MDCYFCKRNITEIDWRETKLLKRFVTGLGKIKQQERTGLCTRHQKRTAKSIKRARHLGLLSPMGND